MRRYERFVEIDAPVERVFDIFADFEAAPHWAGGILDVRRTGRRTFRWTAETALDIDVEWEAEVIVFAPDRRIVWRSVGGDIHADCEAVFSVTPADTTLLRVVRGYDTPGGRTGRAVARFFGRHPEEQLEDDLAHLRRLAERSRRMGGGRVPPGRRVERDEMRRARQEEPRARYALTPREREQERERERERDRQDNRTADEGYAPGRFLYRGVDRLLERSPEERRGRRG